MSTNQVGSLPEKNSYYAQSHAIPGPEQSMSQAYSADRGNPPPYTQSAGVKCITENQQVLKDWQHDICGCFNDISFCILTYFFPCISEYMVAKKARLQELSRALLLLYIGFYCIAFLQIGLQITTHTVGNHGWMNVIADNNWLLWSITLVASLLIFASLVIMRFKIRKKQKIVGSSVGDFCWVFWCRCCATCQEYQELKFAEEELRVVRT